MSKQADRERELRTARHFGRLSMKFTSDDVAALLGCSRSVANSFLNKAEGNGVVRRAGVEHAGTGGGWAPKNLWAVVYRKRLFDE